MVRVLSLIVLIAIPMDLERARSLYHLSRRIVSYTALEVMLITTPLIGQAFGPVVGQIFNAKSIPECGPLGEIFPDTHCFSIDIKPQLGCVRASALANGHGLA